MHVVRAVRGVSKLSTNHFLALVFDPGEEGNVTCGIRGEKTLLLFFFSSFPVYFRSAGVFSLQK